MSGVDRVRGSMVPVLLVACAVGLLGCDKVQKSLADKVERSGSMISKDKIEAPKVVRVSHEEGEQFANAMLQAAKAGDGSAVSQLVDWKTLTSRAMAGLEVSDAIMTQMASQLSQPSDTNQLIGSIAAATEPGMFTVLRQRDDERGRWVTFRRLDPAGGFEHLEFLLSKQGEKVQAVDAMILTNGELISAVFRRALLPVVQHQNRNLLARLTGEENAYLKHIETLAKASTALGAKKPREALSMIESLPQELQGMKLVLLLRLRAAGEVDTESPGDPSYPAALGALMKHHPKDPAALVASIDYHTVRKEYPAALAAMDQVAKTTAQDPYFDVVRSGLLLMHGQHEASLKSAERAIAAEPTLQDAHWAAVATSLAMKRYDELAKHLLQIRQRFGIDIEVAGIPEYAEFRRWSGYPEFARAIAQ